MTFAEISKGPILKIPTLRDSPGIQRASALMREKWRQEDIMRLARQIIQRRRSRGRSTSRHRIKARPVWFNEKA